MKLRTYISLQGDDLNPNVFQAQAGDAVGGQARPASKYRPRLPTLLNIGCRRRCSANPKPRFWVSSSLCSVNGGRADPIYHAPTEFLDIPLE
jgi:hypothetical protein